jgi:beta-lactamase superfamily II metal-dependent hydrolase
MSLVKSLSVGHADMFYIKHNSDNFTIIDCCMSEDNQYRFVNELKRESEGKAITRFISTHPDEDHIAGLTFLHEKMPIWNFYCVKNATTKLDETEDFIQYCALRDDAKKAFYIFKGCSRKWMNESNEERKSSGISILWPDRNNKHFQEALAEANEGGSPNNISPIVQYDLNGGTTILWMGDLGTEFMENLDTIPVGPGDILFAPHHGRASGRVPSSWLEKIKPMLIVIGEAPSEHLHYYDGYNKITQNCAGDITFDCVAGKTHIYVSEPDYSVDFLDNEEMPDEHGFYIGTLNVKN